MGLSLSGTGGEVLVGYQRAARLGSWHLESVKKDHGQVQAEVFEVDDWWMAQRPTCLKIFTPRCQWVWTAVEPIRSNAWRVQGAPRIEKRTDVTV